MSKRKIELSVLNVLFCLLVILIHIMSNLVECYEPGTVSYSIVMIPWRLMSFVVQGFILLSGLKLFLAKKDEMPYLQYLKYRFFSVIVPYLICCVAYNIFASFFFDVKYSGLQLIDVVITGRMEQHLYFVPLLVQFDLLMPVWKKMVDKWSPLLIIPVSIIGGAIFETNLIAIVGIFTNYTVPVYNDRMFTTYIAFWVVGCYIGRYYDQFCELVKSQFKVITTIFVTTTVFCAFASFFAYNNFAYLHGMNYIHYIYALVMIVFLLAVLQLHPIEKFKDMRLFNDIDTNSYGLYLWHFMALRIAELFVNALNTDLPIIEFLFKLLFGYGITLSVVFGYSMLMDYLRNMRKKLKKDTQTQEK